MRASVLMGGLVASALLLLFLPLFGRTARGTDPVLAPVERLAAILDPAGPPPRTDWTTQLARPGRLSEVATAVASSRWTEVLARLSAEPPGAEKEGAETLETLELELVSGLSLLRGGRPDESLSRLMSAARRADSADHPLAAQSWSLLAEAAGVTGELDLRLRALERAEALQPGSAEGQAALAQALVASGEPERALALVRSALQRTGEPAARSRLLGAGLEAPGAGREERRAWIAELGWIHPVSPAAASLAGSPLWVATLDEAIAEERWSLVLERLEVLVVANWARTALPEIERLLAAGPPSACSDRARQLQGRAFRVLRRHADALKASKQVGASDALVRVRAKYNGALAARALKRRGDYRQLLEEAADGPACEWRDRALERLADQDIEAGRREAARERWTVLAREGAEESTRAEAAWRLAWSFFEEGEREPALTAFTRLADDLPRRSQAAASLYWSSRILKGNGEDTEAGRRLIRLAAEHPFDYYGLLAATELGREPERPRLARPGELEEALGEALGELELREPAGAERAAALWRTGQVRDLIHELEAQGVLPGAGTGRERWALRVALLGESGRHREALIELRSSVPDWRTRHDLPALAWSGAYPRAYPALVEQHAELTGLDPALVYALIHQESVFDAGAVSHAGARGLMQIMPGTNRTIAGWFKEKAHTADLVDPEHNVRYGTTYLRRLLDQLEHPELALAGYNAGGTRARRWWGGLSERDLPLFVESIPFDETRHYVKAVTWNRHLYGGALQGVGGASGQ